VGAILIQKDEDGHPHPVAYASRKMTTAETLYSTREQEALAILFAIEKFDEYVRGRRFTVITDHRSLSWLMKVPVLKGRLLNWAYKLRAYDFDIVYRKGSENAMADMLSRLHKVDAQRARLHLVDTAIKAIPNKVVFARVPLGDEQPYKPTHGKIGRRQGTWITGVYPAHPTMPIENKQEVQPPQPQKRGRGRPRKITQPAPAQSPQEEAKGEKKRRIGMRTRALERAENKGDPEGSGAHQEPQPVAEPELDRRLRLPPGQEANGGMPEAEPTVGRQAGKVRVPEGGSAIGGSHSKRGISSKQYTQ